MSLHPTTLLTGLLLALLAFDFKDAKLSASQSAPLPKQSATAIQQADGSVQTFHRGSGRRQFFWMGSTLANV